MHRTNPRILHFHITSRCPYNCKHCCSQSGPQRNSAELEIESILEILDRAIRFGIEEFDLSGGEPLIVEKSLILETILYASKRNLVTTINTNSWFLDKEHISDLKDAGLDRMKFSLYGTSSRVHDEFTGTEGSFEKIANALGLLKDKGIEVWINYVVTPKNLDETFVLPSLLDPYDVDTIQLSSIIPSGRGKGAREYLFSDRELGNVITTLEALFPNSTNRKTSFTTALYPSPDNYPFDDRYCDYLIDRLVVDSSGHVIPCCILPEDIRSVNGNILKEDFEEICSSQGMKEDPVFYWLGKGHRAMREALKFERKSNNLCSTCIEMLTILKQKNIKWCQPLT